MKQILHFPERLSRHNEREGFTALTALRRTASGSFLLPD